MQLEEMQARLAIQDTVARYVRWGDAGRSEEFSRLFTEECCYDFNGEVFRSRAEVFGFLEGMKSRLIKHFAGARVSHHVSSVVIELQGPTQARSWSYFSAVGPKGPDVWGNYRDRLVKVGDEWLFAERRVQIDGAVTGSVVAPRG